MTKKVIKFIDSFAGLGGTRIGFQQAVKSLGLKSKCVFASEIKPHAIKTYKMNFPKTNLHGDITKIPSKVIPNFNYLLGGFPCQSFSTAGKQLGFKDTRGTMFFQIARILKNKQPQGFLLENVPHLLKHDKGKTFQVIYNTLIQLGYSVGYQILDSSYFGLAQKRKRLYIIGKRDKHPHQLNLHIHGQNHAVNVKNIIDYQSYPKVDNFSKQLFKHYSYPQVIGKRIRNNRGTKYNLHTWNFELNGKTTLRERHLLNKMIPECRKHIWAKEYGIKWSDGMPLTEKMIASFCPYSNLHKMLKDLVHKHYLKYTYPKETVHHHRIFVKSVPKGYRIVSGALAFEYNKILNPNGKTPTLTATDMSKLAIPVHHGIRPINTREGLRLFGFPKTYQIKGITQHQAYDLIGNTVCVPVIKAVAKKLL